MKKLLLLSFVSVLFAFSFALAAFASVTDGTIPVNSYAWGENIGWINFGATNGNIHVTDTAVTGYAWSSTYGWINFSPTNGGVTNTCTGTLGGNAWSSSLGWIPFSGVTINASGKFTGIAGTAGSTAGRINFDCTNCNVTTDWRQCSLRATPTQQPGPTATPGPGPTATPGPGPTATPTPGIITQIVNQFFPPPTPTPPASPQAPSQLFDIALIIDDPLIEDSRTLTARVTFTSFGTEDTPVDMEFVVLDGQGRELHKTSGKTVIQTEGIYNQTFPDLQIPDGKYTLVLKTSYGEGVHDEFRQPFEVRIGAGAVCCHWWIVPVEALIILYLLRRRRRQRQEEKNRREVENTHDHA